MVSVILIAKIIQTYKACLKVQWHKNILEEHKKNVLLMAKTSLQRLSVLLLFMQKVCEVNDFKEHFVLHYSIYVVLQMESILSGL